MRKSLWLLSVLAMAVIAFSLFVVWGLPLSERAFGQGAEPTETPYWNDYPPQKRAYFETAEALRAEALKLPQPGPGPTFPPVTEAPLILKGTKKGIGFLIEAGGHPLYDISNLGWAYQDGDKTYVVNVGRMGKEFSEDSRKEIGIVILYTFLTNAPSEVSEDTYYTTGKDGKLEIVDVDGKKLKLKTDKGKKFKFDIEKRKLEDDIE